MEILYRFSMERHPIYEPEYTPAAFGSGPVYERDGGGIWNAAPFLPSNAEAGVIH